MKGAIHSSQSGFTLVEMLVALGIFSLISVAGMALLQSASNTQLAVKGRLGDLGTSARAVAVMESDLAQAVARTVRTTSTNSAAAFASGGSETTGQLFAFTRMGWSNLDEAPRSEVQRVAYALQDGVLRRISWTALDGGAPKPALLLHDVVSVNVRFRSADGSWRIDWDSGDPLALPRAIELNIMQQNAAPVTLLFLVGTSGSIMPVKLEQEGENGDPT